MDTDTSEFTVFVTKGDTNDAQLELTLASHWLWSSIFSTQIIVETSMGTGTPLNQDTIMLYFLDINENYMAKLSPIFSFGADYLFLRLEDKVLICRYSFNQ